VTGAGDDTAVKLAEGERSTLMRTSIFNCVKALFGVEKGYSDAVHHSALGLPYREIGFRTDEMKFGMCDSFGHLFLDNKDEISVATTSVSVTEN